jgi:hypothetical protein
MLSVIYAKCHIQALYAACDYPECCFAECRGANYTTSIPANNFFQSERVKNTFLISVTIINISVCLLSFRDKTVLSLIKTV